MKIQSPKLSFWERIYVVEVVRGLWVTLRHLLYNVIHQREMPTVQFPEAQKLLPVRHKSRHRLMLRDDGSPKCVACMCCPTACPARCINIVAEESGEAWIEKRPKVFEIDLLRCVFCGYCVEACPEDAIRMDTDEVLIVSDRREDFIVGMDFLLHGKGDQWKQVHGREGSAPAQGEPVEPPSTPEEIQPVKEGLPWERPRPPSAWETPATEAHAAEMPATETK